MADAYNRHARRLSYALECAIIYVVDNIAFSRRGVAVLVIR